MRVEIYFSSSKCERAATKRFFKLPFEWQAIPPNGAETAVPVECNRVNLTLKGVRQDVRITGNLGKALFRTEMSPEDMREAVLPGGLRLKEVANWLD